MTFDHPRYTLEFHNTNHLLRNEGWDIQLTKTGYTDEAGRCLTMRTTINHRQVALVTLDAYGKYTHFADANRLKSWLETQKRCLWQKTRKVHRNRKPSASNRDNAAVREHTSLSSTPLSGAITQRKKS